MECRQKLHRKAGKAFPNVKKGSMTFLHAISWNRMMSRLEEQDRFRILIIRPGETIFDVKRHIQGNLDLHLTEKGCREVSEIADELNQESLDFIYTSPNASAVETADRLASHLNVPRRILKGLLNQNQGLWQGLSVEELQRQNPRIYRCAASSPERVVPPQGESIVSVQIRLRKTIQRILKHHRTGTIGLVLCEPAASLASCWLKDEQARNLWDYLGRHCRWESVEITYSELKRLV